MLSRHGSLSSNLIGQNGYFGVMRPPRDSGSQFKHKWLLYGSPNEIQWGNCNLTSICTQNFKSKLTSLKIERLILSIPLNTIENGISEKF